MGDCLHQRAVLRQLLRAHTVTLETSWASMYHDLIPEGLTVVRRPVGLRTQNKNQNREAALFSNRQPKFDRSVRIRYGGTEVMRTKSQTVLEAMCNAVECDYGSADYRLPVPQVWTDALRDGQPWWAEYANQQKPLLVYRPLVARPEWKGSIRRNADPTSYARLFAQIRDAFFVVSVADLEPGREWLVGPELRADVALHKGELNFELLAALFKEATLVYTSSGFAAILAPAVGTPCASIVGGYEHKGAHDSGMKFAPFLSLGPSVPCTCFSSQCRRPCQTEIDMSDALPQLQQFLLHNVGGVWAIPPARNLADVYDLVPDSATSAPPPPAQPFPPLAHPNHSIMLKQMRAAAWAKGHRA